MTERTSQRESREHAFGSRAAAEHEPQSTVWEWLIAAIGAVLLLASLGYLTYIGIEDDGVLPTIEIAVQSVEPAAGEYRVRIAVTNRGDITAAGLNIEATLHGPEGVVETSQTSLTFVPADSTRLAGLYFENNPAEYDLRIRPTGYELP